jgi:soluble lytic murein transglycosylase-like protein
MILAFASKLSVAVRPCLAAAQAAMLGCALCVALPAQADVMEVGADGARWVAGGTPASAGDPLSVEAAVAASLTSTPFEMDGTIVPDRIVADISTNARGVPARYVVKIAELSQRFDLSPSLLEALVWQESRWRENAVSHAGARGLAQLMPGTARYLGVDPGDPMQNLEGGARYLREQLDRFDGDLEKALAAYNAGPGRVIRAGGIPNIRETKLYVASIMGRLASHARPEAR